jgi:hypothetical protein
MKRNKNVKMIKKRTNLYQSSRKAVAFSRPISIQPEIVDEPACLGLNRRGSIPNIWILY